MGKSYDHIPSNLIKFIQKQEVFWVATSALSGDGHVNVSPKGIRGTFRVESPNKVWYDDLSGSGCETMAHLRENGRITFLFNALEGSMMILRLYGRGVAYELGTPEYESLLPASQRLPGSRAVVVAEIHRVATSCGWGIPVYTFQGNRRILLDFFHGLEKNEGAVDMDAALSDTGAANSVAVVKSSSSSGIRAFWERFNQQSIDGLPAFAIHESETPLAFKMPDPATAGFRNSDVKMHSDIRPVESQQVILSTELVTKEFWNTRSLVTGFALGLLVCIVGDICKSDARHWLRRYSS